MLLLTIVLLSCAAFADSETESVTADGEMQVTEEAAAEETPENKLLAQIKKMLPVILGMTGNDPQSSKEWIIEQVKKIAKNPDQYSEDFWDSLFGTGADGISREGDAEEKGKISFAMELPDPVRMPDTYSVAYHRADKEKNEITTLLERDADGNIHYLDGEEETVFVRTDRLRGMGRHAAQRKERARQNIGLLELCGPDLYQMARHGAHGRNRISRAARRPLSRGAGDDHLHL